MNPWEQLRRTEKAQALVDAIEAHGKAFGLATIDPDAIAAWSPADWATMARAAGVIPPSHATVELVVSSFRRRAKFAAATAALAELAASRGDLTADLGVVPFEHASGRPRTTINGNHFDLSESATDDAGPATSPSCPRVVAFSPARSL